MIEWWRKVVFETTPSRPVAVARIAVAGAVLLKAVSLWPLIFALRNPTILRLPFASWIPALPGAMIPLLMVTWIIAGVAFLLGWRTKIAGTVLFLALVCALFGDQQLYSSHLYLAAIVTVLLTLADSGAALSLDARRRGERSRVRAWPVTLLKVQVSVVYAFAALTKLNPEYLSGAILNIYVGRGSVIPLPDAARRWEVLAPFALLSILVEIFLALGLWSGRWRPTSFVVGLAFHASIVLTMVPPGELIVFSILMFSVYLLHLDATVHSRLAIWDDGSGHWRRWVPRLKRLDWLRVHRFVPRSSSERPVRGADPGGRGIELIGPDARFFGVGALGEILERIPVSFLWAPVLRNRWLREMTARVAHALR